MDRTNNPPPWNTFSSDIGKYPYCTDNLTQGIGRQPTRVALNHKYVGVLPPHIILWMFFDVDRSDAATRWEDACLRAPNVIVINPDNGRGHLGYRLAVPVARHDKSRLPPLRYLAAVERGMVRRLDADRGYAGHIAKNPLHPHWRTMWCAGRSYALGDLAAELTHSDMRRWPRDEVAGFGRNCTLFAELRRPAYRMCRQVKSDGGTQAHLLSALIEHGHTINANFLPPLPQSEVRATCRSICKWSWRHITPRAFSAVQAARGQRSGAKRLQLATTRQAALQAYLSDMVRVRAEIEVGHHRRLADKFGVSERTIRRDLMVLAARSPKL